MSILFSISDSFFVRDACADALHPIVITRGSTMTHKTAKDPHAQLFAQHHTSTLVCLDARCYARQSHELACAVCSVSTDDAQTGMYVHMEHRDTATEYIIGISLFQIICSADTTAKPFQEV